MTATEQQWRDYRADVAATRRDALARLAPDARAAATLAAYRANRKRADWRKLAIVVMAIVDVLAIAATACAAL